MYWIRGDDVELFSRREHVVPRVVIDDSDLQIRRDVVVRISEVSRDYSRDERLEFADHHLLDRGVDAECARGDAGAEADDENALRALLVHQRGEVAEQPLQPHVLRFGGRFHFSADVKTSPAVGAFRYGNRGVDAFAHIQRPWLSVPRKEAAPCHKSRRHMWHGRGCDSGARHQRCQHEHGTKTKGAPGRQKAFRG